MKTQLLNKKFIAWWLVFIWLLMIAFAFWWFELRWYRQVDFQYSDALFDSRTLLNDQSLLQGKDHRATVVHYFDPACPCTRFNTAHVQELMATYLPKGVAFVIKVPNEAARQLAHQTFKQVPIDVVAAKNAPVASPAALVLNPLGQPEYVGPYSPGAVCTSKTGDFVGLALDDVIQGKGFKQTINLANGCFCQWPV